MADQRRRDKERTRERIAQVATVLFLERGFQAVTVAEVAAAAGVSKVTVFAHFPRKEDLLLDRGPEALTLVRAAVRDRPPGVGPVQALRALAVNLAGESHPLSGLTAGSRPFLRTVAASPELISRARELLDELEQDLGALLASELAGAGDTAGAADAADARLLAALIIAAYRSVVTETVRQIMKGDPLPGVAAGHRRRLDAAFDVLETAAAPLGFGAAH
jgi:AcrR family transcriptional regulator